MSEKKAQVAAEYLIISGFLLLAVIVFFIYSISSYNDSVSFTKAKNVVDSLSNTASQLSGLGNGSSLVVDLEFPENIQSFQVSGKTFRLFLTTGSGTQEYYAESRLDLNSAVLPLTSGFHSIKVSRLNNKVDFVEVK
ncbi:MAG: hypothetical protein Q7R70_03120 [Candidatus Diapherotrites archaeon]|nr:hypothetical protein [Candidatus Diapherotrites archaeon]